MEAAVLGDDTVNHKPHLEPINKSIELLGIAKEKIKYIGDTSDDYLALKNASIDFGYAKCWSVCDKGISNPEYIFENHLDLLNLLNI